MFITYQPQGKRPNSAELTEAPLVFQRSFLCVHSHKPVLQAALEGDQRLLLLGECFTTEPDPNGPRHPLTSQDVSIQFANLIQEHGLDQALSQVEGQFLGLLVDPDGGAVLFADSFHRRELFYAENEGAFWAATDIILLAKRLPSKECSQEALASCLTMYGNYAPKRHTIYKDVKRLGVGERIKLSGGNAWVEQHRFEPLPTQNYQDDQLAEYARILREAVAIRGSVHHNWLFMSSGFDSSTLLALLAERYGPDRVTAVIGRMHYSTRAGIINQFELDRAQLIAEHYGIALDVVDLDYTTPDSISHVKKVAKAMRGHHLYLNSAYNFYLLSEHIASKAGPDDAVFAGEVSDAVHNLGFSQFASILEHPDLGFREYSDKMASYLFGPSFLKRALKGDHESDLVFQIFKQRNGQERFLSTAGMDEMSIKSTFLASFFLRKRRVPFFGHANNPALTPEGNAWFDQTMRAEYLDEYAASLTPENLYSIMLHLYHSFHWQGATPMNMAASVRDLLHREVAMPFWDRRLHAFLSQAPENWGRGLEIRPTKYPLKWMLEHELHYPMHLQTGPHSYLYDVNPQFSHTSEFLFGSALAPYFKEKLASRPYRRILSPEWFNIEYLDGLVQRYVAGEEFGGDEAGALLDLVNLCIVGWFE